MGTIKDRSLSTWAELVRYPAGERAAGLPLWIDELLEHSPGRAVSLEPLREWVRTHTPGELEELFVRTFENNKERALELGWHLYGENYARGTFMARMRGLLRDLGISETVELPDHLSHILLVLERGESDLVRALVRGVVLPALTKIEDGFSDEANPYRGVITGMRVDLAERFLGDELDEEEVASDE